MEYKLKPISKAGIAEATAKVELYRYLNEPEEAESIFAEIFWRSSRCTSWRCGCWG